MHLPKSTILSLTKTEIALKLLMNILSTSEVDRSDSVKADDIDVFLTGPFALPTIHYSKTHQLEQYLDKTCYLTFHS
jgi:hypothetical protein